MKMKWNEINKQMHEAGNWIVRLNFLLLLSLSAVGFTLSVLYIYTFRNTKNTTTFERFVYGFSYVILFLGTAALFMANIVLSKRVGIKTNHF